MNVGRVLRAAGPAIGLVFTWTLFAALAGGTFVAWNNQELMLLQTAVVGTAAVGATWIIVSGGIDLSVGANIALSSMVGAAVLRDGHGFWLAALATVACGCVVGFLIGALVTGALLRVVLAFGAGALVAVFTAADMGAFWAMLLAVGVGAAVWLATARVRWSLPLSPFIVTLGLWGTLRGLAKGLGGSQPIYFEADDTLSGLMLPGALLPAGVWVLLAVAVARGARC